MPYPPRPPRKHPNLSVAEARTRHLVPYQFRPGQSGNPDGMSREARELYLEAKGLLHQAGPLAIRRLIRLAGLDLERGELMPDDQLPDPRVVLIAAQSLAEREYGKPREMPPEPVPGEDRHFNFSITFPEPKPQPIDVTPALPEQASPEQGPERALEVARTGGLRKATPAAAVDDIRTAERLPVQNSQGFSGRRR
jgi:hypothetical protein